MLVPAALAAEDVGHLLDVGDNGSGGVARLANGRPKVEGVKAQTVG